MTDHWNKHPVDRQDTRLPVWLLDVDGVLCPYGDPPPGSMTFEAPIPDGGKCVLTMWANPRIVEALLQVADRCLAEIRWLTSWGQAARDTIAPALGLPDWPLVGPPDPWALTGPWRDRPWKMPQVTGLLQDNPDLPGLAWADDDIVPSTRRLLATQCPGHPTAIRLVRPYRNTGLTMRQVQDTTRFLRGVGSQS